MFLLDAALEYEPTATQRVVSGQDTALSRGWNPFSGVGTTEPLVPFQVSTSVPTEYPPTTVQRVGETQKTPFRTPSTGRLGFGASDHVEPFQDSTSVLSSVSVLVFIE